MANTTRAGTTSAHLFHAEVPFLLGIPRGRSPFGQWTNGRPNVVVSPESYFAAGTRTAVTKGTPASNNVARAGAVSALLTTGDADWFERMHILPKAGIEFGNIVAQTDADYEIYNAWRDRDVVLTAVANNATPGVELPNLSVPTTVEKETSQLDPTSTGNGSGTGLGTLVKLKVRALTDGLPSFDTTIDFSFDTGEELSLPISGQRIVLVPLVYEWPVQETLSFATDIIDALNGKEQRIALRDNPRQLFDVLFLLDGNDRQRMEALLMDWTDNVFAFPLWHERLFLTTATSVGATQYQVLGADEVDLRDLGLALVFSDANTYDVINVASHTATLVTAASPSQFAYPVGTILCPLRTAQVSKVVSSRRHYKTLQEYAIQFEVTDNDTGALAGDTTPGFWSTHGGRVLLDDCNFMEGTMSEERTRRVYRIDNLTGIVRQSSTWDKEKRVQQKGFEPSTRAQILQLRKLLVGLGGSQKTFYIPTFIEDLTVVANLSSGTNTMDIERMEYVRHMAQREPRKTFKVTFTDGTSLVRTISSSAVVSTTVERLTLNTTWPANRSVSEISRVEFYEPVRFDTEDFQLTHTDPKRASMQVPVKAVFDDD